MGDQFLIYAYKFYKPNIYQQILSNFHQDNNLL